MMLLFKIAQMFLLPSIFIFILLVLGLALFILKKRAGKILLITGIAFYYLFSITPIADLILLPLENQYQPLEEKINSAQTIVLLVGGVREGDLPLSSVLTESTLSRAAEAMRIYLKGNQTAKIIISGTNPISPEKNEALLVAKFLESLNIPKEDIILEEKSRNTYESAREVKKMVGEKPFILVTSAYHLPRAIYIFEKLGLNPIPAPADYKIGKEYSFLDFFPQPANLKKTNSAFHEYFGLLFYHLK